MAEQVHRGPTMIALRATRQAIQVAGAVRDPAIDGVRVECTRCGAWVRVVVTPPPDKIACPRCRRVTRWPEGWRFPPEDTAPTEEELLQTIPRKATHCSCLHCRTWQWFTGEDEAAGVCCVKCKKWLLEGNGQSMRRAAEYRAAKRRANMYAVLSGVGAALFGILLTLLLVSLSG